MRILLTVFLLVLAAPGFAKADSKYVVRRGDTLLKIADRALGTTNDPRRFEIAKQIRALNPQLTNPNVLTVGETLTVPDVGGTAKTPTDTVAAKPIPKVEPPPPLPTPMPTPVAVEPTPPPAAVAETAAPAPPPPPLRPAPPVPPPPAPKAAPPASRHVEDHVHAANAAEIGDFLAVHPRYHFVDVKVKTKPDDKESEIISKESAGLDLIYGKAWGERTHFLVDVGFTYTDFGSFSTDNTSLDQNVLWHKNFGLGVAYELTHSLHLDFMAKAADRTFFVPGSTTTYVAQSVLVPGAELAFSWDAIHTQSFTYGISIVGEYLAATSFNGVNYDAAVDPIGVLYMNSERGADRFNYRASLTYDKRDQTSNLTEQAETNWIVGLDLIFPL